MAIEKTQGISLGVFALGDTSQIATFLTRDFGLIRCVAKGSRSKKNRFGYSLQPIILANIVFYHRPRRELFTLSQSDVCQSYPEIRSDLLKSAYAQVSLELLKKILLPADKNCDVFIPTLRLFDKIQKAQNNPECAFSLVCFLCDLCFQLGFHPCFNSCHICSGKTPKMYLDLSEGKLFCGQCAPKPETKVISCFASEIIQAALISGKLPTGTGEKECLESIHVLLDFLSYHLERSLKLSSVEFLRSITESQCVRG